MRFLHTDILTKLTLLIAVQAVAAAPSRQALSSRDSILLERLQQVCKSHYPGEVPLDKPAFEWDKKADSHPRDYLKDIEHPFGKGNDKPYGKKLARWRQQFFHPDKHVDDDDLEYSKEPEVDPLRPGAPTIVTLFYPDAGNTRRSPEKTVARFKPIADMGEQMMIYTTEAMRPLLEKLRSDKHFRIVTDFEDVFDLPFTKELKDDIMNQQVFAPSPLPSSSLSPPRT